MDETAYFSSQNFKFSILNKTENCASHILPKNAGFMFEEKVVKIKNEYLFLKIFSLFLLPESALSEGQYQPRSLPGFKAQSSFDCSSSKRYQLPRPVLARPKISFEFLHTSYRKILKNCLASSIVVSKIFLNGPFLSHCYHSLSSKNQGDGLHSFFLSLKTFTLLFPFKHLSDPRRFLP